MKITMSKMLFLLGMFTLPFVALADVGELDTTFGNGKGWVSFSSLGSYRNYQDTPVASLQRTDGKWVMVGWDTQNITEISRHNADGSLDTGFNSTGLLTIPRTDQFAGTDSAILLPDNKMILVGSAFDDSGSGYSNVALARLNEDGSFDTGFGKAGVSMMPYSGGVDEIQCQGPIRLIRQSDGKLVISCRYDPWLLAQPKFFLVRFNRNGSLDTSFGGDGISDDTALEYGSSIVQQADGKLVAAGINRQSGLISVMRLNNDGTLDTTFNGTGVYTSDERGGIFSSVIQQDDGRLVVLSAGQLLRLNANGTLDTSFSSDGKTTIAIGDIAQNFHSMMEDSNHNLVMMGFALDSDPVLGRRDEVKLARLLANGDLDTTFGVNGVAGTGMHEGYEMLPALLPQADGKWLVSSVVLNTENNTRDFDIRRLTGDGAVDTTFGNAGVLHVNFGGFETDGAAATAAIQQQDGKIVTAGWLYDQYSTHQFGLVRYNLNGSLDTTFNSTGNIVSTLNDNRGDSNLWDLIQQQDGKLVAVGWTNNDTVGETAIVRYNLDGTYDTTFAGDGVVTMGTPLTNGTFFSVQQQSDGKLVASGYSYNLDSALYESLLVRYNPDGSLDTSFNGSGIVSDARSYMINSSIQQSDGKLVTVGVGDSNGFRTMRYNIDGSIDSAFGIGGIVNTETNIWGHSAQRVIQQPDGKLVVAGASAALGVVLARYNSDGSLDETFGGVGFVNNGAESESSLEIKRIYLQNDGKMLLLVTGYNGENKTAFVLRMNADGSRDTRFGVDGYVRASMGPALQGSSVNSAIVQTDGKLVVVGESGIAPVAAKTVFDDVGTARIAFSESSPAIAKGMFTARFKLIPDSDEDGVDDGDDICLKRKNPNQSDIDGDGLGDVCDKDRDGDGIKNIREHYPDDPTRAGDRDKDGVDRLVDNCPHKKNADQADLDGDGIGDACDRDRDGDGIKNIREHYPDDPTRAGDRDKDGVDRLFDNCPYKKNADQADLDGDSIGNACDKDIDGDRFQNSKDHFPLDPNKN